MDAKEKKVRNVSEAVMTNESLQKEITCPTCNGEGNKSCVSCHGAGIMSVRRAKSLHLI